MKVEKLIISILLLISFLLPYITFAHAANKPAYVGINEQQTIIWNTEFHRGPFEDYFEDRGKTEEYAEEQVNDTFNDFKWDKKVEAWKLYIVEIKGEEEENVLLPTESINDDYDRVKYIYNLYKSKDKENIDAWKKMEQYETGKIWESDEDLYEALFMPYYGLSSGEVEHLYPALIVANDLKWTQVADKHEEEYYKSVLDDFFNIDEVKVQYFHTKKAVGIRSEVNPACFYPIYERDLKNFETIMKYNDDGILYYYEFSYGGEIIAKFELESIFGPFIIENWWWIASVTAVALIAVVIIIIFKKKMK